MWIRDVDVPAELVEAARAGRLVVFVGAGASVDPPASLPDFTGLVRAVGARAGTHPTDHDLKRLDRFLGSLHDRGVRVHDLVAAAISRPGSPNRLHEAIVALAQAHPPIRIVTTNYDRHLTAAAEAAGIHVDIFRGPALPEGDDFTGIVHLHGALGQEARRLIITDTDFGNAYLRSAWAARFLERMFATFTVLFIGYSYSDLVMQYLGRSLDRTGTRYVLTHRQDLPEWRSFGLTPLAYPAPGNSHAALTDLLERWAELSTFRRLDHRRLVADLVGTGLAVPGDPASSGAPTRAPERVLTPEETSYLDETVGDAERIRYFVQYARGDHWLTWIADRPQFDGLFIGAEPADEQTRIITQALTTWIADHYVTQETESPAALRLLCDRRWTQATLSTIAQRLVARDGVIPDWQTPWLLLALQQHPLSPNTMLDVLLTDSSWSQRPDLALVLLEHRLRPVITAGFDVLDTTTPPSFTVEVVGEEQWLTTAWTTVFLPLLPQYASAILRMVIGHIQSAYRMLRSLHGASTIDSVSFGRSAIEPHEQDGLRESWDVIIDAARDCLEHQLLSDPSAIAVDLDRWMGADEALIRRLAVHGWRVRTDRDADQKLRQVNRYALYDLDVQHEVFLLLAEAVPRADPATIRALLDNVHAGPPALDEDPPSPYRRYNLLAWLAHAAPEVVAVTDAFVQAQAEHPEYAPREHPDLGVVMTSGVVEDAEPFTVEELHAAISHDPEEALTDLRAHQSVDAFRFVGPTWRGALACVRGCVRTYPNDGLRVADHLRSGDPDLRRAIIEGWAEAELTDTEAAAVIDTIGSWDVDEIRGPAARMLANGGRDGQPTQWHLHEFACALASGLWPTQPVEGNVLASDDRVLEAINHPAGDLAQFWTKVVQGEWTRSQDDWNGLAAAGLAAPLDLMSLDAGRNGLLARTVLAGNMRFYFAADPDWTAVNLLHRFDWNIDSEEASAVWQGFLGYGRPDDRLLEAGMLQYYLQCCQHFDELGRDRRATQLADHLAFIALFTSTNPGSWLPDFITTAPPELREAWHVRVAAKLRDLDSDQSTQQWSRWIQTYWIGRVESVPLPLTTGEASGLAQWVLGVPEQRSDAVQLVLDSPAGFTARDGLLHRLAQTDLSTDALNWTEFVVHLLRGTSDPSWELQHYLPQIAGALRGGPSTPDLSALTEEAMRLGLTEASDW